MHCLWPRYIYVRNDCYALRVVIDCDYSHGNDNKCFSIFPLQMTRISSENDEMRPVACRAFAYMMRRVLQNDVSYIAGYLAQQLALHYENIFVKQSYSSGDATAYHRTVVWPRRWFREPFIARDLNRLARDLIDLSKPKIILVTTDNSYIGKFIYGFS